MLRTASIRHDHSAAGSLNSLLAVWGFVDDRTFITKAGHLGAVYRLKGIDGEGLTDAERQAVVHRFEAALRILDEHCRVYQYICKRRMAPLEAPTCRTAIVDDAIRTRADYLNARRNEMYELDLFLVLVYEGLRPRWTTATRLEGVLRQPRRALREWLTGAEAFHVIEADLDRAHGQFEAKASAFEVQVADSIRPERLNKHQAFKFLRGLVNYDESLRASANLAYDTHVDYFVADSPLECHRTHLSVGDAHVAVLTMKEPPVRTFAHVLEGLHTVPGEYIACLEWRRLPAESVRRDIHSRRRHFFNKRISLVNYVTPESRPDEMLVDDSADAVVRQLGEALTAAEVDGHFFGECGLTLVLFDHDSRAVERAASEAMKVMAAHDGAFVKETYNLLNAWLAVMPGNSAHNLRRIALLETNCADLSFLFSLDCGERTSPHLHQPALAVFESRHQTPYFFNLHVDDVGHTAVFGATGSGKSFLLNFLITHAQQYEPDTIVFDIGHGYRKLATLLGGSYLEVGLGAGELSINPFALPPTPEHLHFLHAFVRVLTDSIDGHHVSEAEDRELYDAIENLYVLDRSQRRLFTLANVLPRALAGRLSRWIEGGRYAAWFDHVDDTLSIHRFQVFDFEAMAAYPDVLEPLLFYVLHRASERVMAGNPAGLKLCVMDEAWRFIQHERLRAYVQEALKTWRKRNGAMLLATQSIEDFKSADLLRTVVESCPTKLLLANPSLDRDTYRELFQLNEAELDLAVDLAARQQFLLKRPHLAKVLALNVDPKSYWIYTNTPTDNAHAADLFREHGFAGGLDALVASA